MRKQELKNMGSELAMPNALVYCARWFWKGEHTHKHHFDQLILLMGKFVLLIMFSYV